MITSETRVGSMPAWNIAALIAALPSSWAGSEANAPLNEPTGVRVALAMTMSSFMGGFLPDYEVLRHARARRGVISCYVISTRPAAHKAKGARVGLAKLAVGMQPVTK